MDGKAKPPVCYEMAKAAMAMGNVQIAGGGWQVHAEEFVGCLSGLDGGCLPGVRRHVNRLDTGPRAINKE